MQFVPRKPKNGNLKKIVKPSRLTPDPYRGKHAIIFTGCPHIFGQIRDSAKCYKCGVNYRGCEWPVRVDINLPDLDVYKCDHRIIRVGEMYVCDKCGYIINEEIIVRDSEYIEYKKRFEKDSYNKKLYVKEKTIEPLSGMRSSGNLAKLGPISHYDTKLLRDALIGCKSWREILQKLRKMGFSNRLNDIPSIFGHSVYFHPNIIRTAHIMMELDSKIKCEFILAKLMMIIGDESYKWIPIPWTKQYLKKYEVAFELILKSEYKHLLIVNDTYEPPLLKLVVPKLP